MAPQRLGVVHVIERFDDRDAVPAIEPCPRVAKGVRRRPAHTPEQAGVLAFAAEPDEPVAAVPRRTEHRVVRAQERDRAADERLGDAGDVAADQANAERAAVFRFALDDTSPAARRLEAGVAWRCRALGLPYGDQGLLLARAFYERLGGFKAIPLMEDVDLVRRIGRRRIMVLDLPAVTSAARYREDGWMLRPLRNLLCLALYLAGVPPRHILRFYG